MKPNPIIDAIGSIQFRYLYSRVLREEKFISITPENKISNLLAIKVSINDFNYSILIYYNIK